VGLAVAAVVFMVYSIGVMVCAWHARRVGVLYWTIGVWALAPPIWFWWEFFYIYNVPDQKVTLDTFKYSQDVSKAIWAGVLAGLIEFSASDHLKPVANAGASTDPPETEASRRAWHCKCRLFESE
jgi:hypothetical protein